MKFQNRIVDYWKLTKPRVSWLALVTVWVGAFAAGAGRGPFDWALFAWTALGVALTAGAAFSLNQLLERETDARMKRTENRPLPAGRISATEALTFATVLAAAGIGVLVWKTTLAASFLAAVTFSSYVFIYTPLKRVTSLNTIIGAFPGALPPMIGWAAVTGRIDLGAWLLFSILFLWQFPHFLAVAWIYRDQYRKAGLRMLSTEDPEGLRTARQMTGYCLVLLPVSLLPSMMGMTGRGYFFGAVVLGLAYFAFAAAFAVGGRTTPRARSLMRVSLAYLPAVLALLTLDLM